MFACLASLVLAQTVVPLGSDLRMMEPPSGAAVFADSTFGWYLVWGDFIEPGAGVVYGARLAAFGSGSPPMRVSRSFIGLGRAPFAASDGSRVFAVWRDGTGTRLAVADAGLRFMAAMNSMPEEPLGVVSYGGQAKVFTRSDGGVHGWSIQNGVVAPAQFIGFGGDTSTFSASTNMSGYQYAWVNEFGHVEGSPPLFESPAAQRVVTSPGIPPVAASSSTSTSWLYLDSDKLPSDWTSPTGSLLASAFSSGSTSESYGVWVANGALVLQPYKSTAVPLVPATAVYTTAGHNTEAMIVFGNDGGGLHLASARANGMLASAEVLRLSQQRSVSAVPYNSGFLVVWEEWRGGSEFTIWGSMLTAEGMKLGQTARINGNGLLRNPRLQASADGGVWLRTRHGNSSNLAPLTLNPNVITPGIGRTTPNDTNTRFALGGGHDLTFGNGFTLNGAPTIALSTEGVRCVAYDGVRFATLAPGGWVTSSNGQGVQVPLDPGYTFDTGCMTAVDAGLVGFVYLNSSTSGFVGLRDSPAGNELRKVRLPPGIKEPVVASMGETTLLTAWIDGRSIRVAAAAPWGLSQVDVVASEQMMPNDLSVAMAPAGDALLTWIALNEVDGRTEVRTVLLQASLLAGLAVEPDAGVRDGGSNTDAGSTLSDAGHVDGGSVDGGGSTDGGTTDGGSVDAGSSDAGTGLTNDGGTTADGGTTVEPQDFEPTCGCDAGGGLGVLALMSVMVRRRRHAVARR